MEGVGPEPHRAGKLVSETSSQIQVAVLHEVKDGGRYRIRTYDFHRVKNEVNYLNPSSSLVFRMHHSAKNPENRLVLVTELVTSPGWPRGVSKRLRMGRAT